MLTEVQTYYNLDNSQAGLLQTVFICSYMACSPVFGYLGDRYSRKIIILGAIAAWSVITLVSSFVPQNVSRRLFSITPFWNSCVANQHMPLYVNVLSGDTKSSYFLRIIISMVTDFTHIFDILHLVTYCPLR